MTSSKKSENNLNHHLSNIIYELLSKRFKMRMRQIRQRRSFVQKQMQQSYLLFQKSFFNLFQNFNSEVLKIILQNNEICDNIKNKTISKFLPTQKKIVEEKVENDKTDNFLEVYHLTRFVFNKIVQNWNEDKDFQNLVKSFIYRMAKSSEKEVSTTIQNQTKIIISEQKICSEIMKHFEYTCDSMNPHECKTSKNKFFSLCGIEICGVLVDLEFGLEGSEKLRSFAVIDNKKRFRNLIPNNLSAFLKEVENYSTKNLVNYFFSDIQHDSHNEESFLLYSHKISKGSYTKLINFKQSCVNELLDRWKYLTSEEKYSFQTFKTCIILHNLCKTENVPMPCT